ncbi:MAG: polyprenyl diphosphate synthase [Blastocatellia bacterium]
MQSGLPENQTSGLHVALIMDGNGRWAARRGLPRVAGHRAGAASVRRVVTAAAESGVTTLTLYAFSADNWRRPETEVSALMKLFRAALLRETVNCLRHGIRLSVIGRRDRLPRAVLAAIEMAEARTAGNPGLHVRLAIDYSARESLLRAAALTGGIVPDREHFARLLATAQHETAPAPDVDLLIRTSGEQRLSDFLLWECAYAEFWFTPVAWPDFSGADFAAALDSYYQRDRRFGALPQARASQDGRW